MNDTDPTEPAVVYVAVWNDRPIGVSSHLGDVKAAAVARESKYDPEPREYRWDEHLGGGYWDLMFLNARTGRWNRTTTVIYAAPIVDAPCPCGAEPVHQAGCSGGEA